MISLSNFIPNLAYIRECWAKDALRAIKNGLPFLVAQGESGGIYQTGFVQANQGIYFLFQLLTYYFSWSYSQNLFFYYLVSIIIPFVFLIFLTAFIFKKRVVLFISLYFIFLAAILTWMRGGICIISFPAIMMIGFIFLFFFNKFSFFENRLLLSSLFFLFLGMFYGAVDWIRVFVYQGITIFIFSFLFLKKLSFKKLFLYLLFFLLGFSSFNLVKHLFYQKRDVFFQKSTVKKIKNFELYFNTYPFWQVMYEYLAYMNHPELPSSPRDWSMIAKIKAKYGSDLIPYTEKFDQAAKKELFYFIRKYPFFVLKEIWAKAGIMFFYFLLFSNIALFYIYKNGFYKEIIPFILGGGFYFSIGIVTIPDLTYILGYIYFVILFSIYSVARYYGEKII